jgi:hypothetical protein
MEPVSVTEIARLRPNPRGRTLFADQIAVGITAARRLDQLDHVARDVWRAFGAGVLADDQAETLSAALEARRRALRGDSHTSAAKPQKHLWNGPSRFPPRRPQKSPDRRQSWDRRDLNALSGFMPGRLAIGFTMSELSALAIVAGEVRRHGVCTCSIDELAARAGISRSSVKRALAKAETRKLISVEHRPVRGCKHDTNIICVISTEWGDWLKRRPIGVQRWTPTDRKIKSSGMKGPAASGGATQSSGGHVGERGASHPALTGPARGVRGY